MGINFSKSAMPMSQQPDSDPYSHVPAELRRVIDNIRGYYRSIGHVRRGICLLNAGRPALAVGEFHQAEKVGSNLPSLAACLAVAHSATGDTNAAAAALQAPVANEDGHVVQSIRYAHVLCHNGDTTSAITTLRDAVDKNPGAAELHFQLGTLLAAQGDLEEAELRFTQAITIDRDHADALVSLAMCCGARHAPIDAVEHLRRAQQRRPQDARIGLLLAQAAAAAQAQGHVVHVRVQMLPDEAPEDRSGLRELSQIVESEPDFVDAFLSLHTTALDNGAYAVLLRTLELALERQPEHAELHFHCGRLLDRLGRRADAISRNELAVRLNPSFTQALIELGRLYRDTDRAEDATGRLEQAVAGGADYADVHFMLGELYRGQGRIQSAKKAYRRALTLNNGYSKAQEALDALLV